MNKKKSTVYLFNNPWLRFLFISGVSHFLDLCSLLTNYESSDMLLSDLDIFILYSGTEVYR